ncbi:hypothetical protein AVEN_125116-1 [Araneus ventricosus]|uniref:Uncharacterized protein n=1 Tax=Araneus ventricosus TaxID=182803 RepID=A0A4Y2FTL9_ARAVE|nr:hypothetical protein AVEN_125116-1 [Araneus ventricosus]
MDRLPAVSDTKASSKCIGTRLAKFRFKGEWIGYWLYQIQKYQVNVSGTNEHQYPHVSDTAKTCINPSLVGGNSTPTIAIPPGEASVRLLIHPCTRVAPPRGVVLLVNAK